MNSTWKPNFQARENLLLNNNEDPQNKISASLHTNLFQVVEIKIASWLPDVFITIEKI